MEQQNEIIIYQSQDGTIKVDVLFSEETVWLTQTQIGSLFGKAKSTISEHIKNIFEEGELNENMVVRKFRTTTQHGAIEDKTQSHEVNYYNLDVIISVGYRVKSMQGTQFRIWATQRLRDYIIKGFTLNDERFKSGSSMNYFRELLDRIREIRLSERLFYQQIKDIYANKVTTKKRNAERYSDRIELQGFQSCFRLFVKPSQSPLKPNQDAATLLVRNHARNGDKRTRITKQGVKD